MKDILIKKSSGAENFKILMRSLPNSRNESHIRSFFRLLSFHLNLFPFPLLVLLLLLMLLLRRNLTLSLYKPTKKKPKSHRVRSLLIFFAFISRPHMKDQVRKIIIKICTHFFIYTPSSSSTRYIFSFPCS